MALILTMIGGLIPTFLISRLYLWLTKTWNGGVRRLYVVHGISLITTALIAGMGMADGGAFVPLKAFVLYVVPQSVWLIFDIFRSKKASQVK